MLNFAKDSALHSLNKLVIFSRKENYLQDDVQRINEMSASTSAVIRGVLGRIGSTAQERRNTGSKGAQVWSHVGTERNGFIVTAQLGQSKGLISPGTVHM